MTQRIDSDWLKAEKEKTIDPREQFANEYLCNFPGPKVTYKPGDKDLTIDLMQLYFFARDYADGKLRGVDLVPCLDGHLDAIEKHLEITP